MSTDAQHLTRARFVEMERQLAAVTAERDALLEALRKAEQAQWFYYGDDCSSDACRFSIHECIEDFEFSGGKPKGDHIIQISGARPVPDMWTTLHYFTDEEKDDRQDDEPYTYTIHATAEAARAAIAKVQSA